LDCPGQAPSRAGHRACQSRCRVASPCPGCRAVIDGVGLERSTSPAWLDWFSPTRLAGFKGNTLLASGQPDRAREALQSVLDSYTDDGESLKQRSITLADLAAVAVAQNDPEQACILAETTLDHLARYWYATGMDRVRTVRESLIPWESLPCVRQLDEHLYDWNTTVSILSG
jgi:hypothetical protein